MLGRQQTVQSSVNVCRRPPLGSTNTSFSSPQNAQLYDTSLSLPDVVRRFDCRSPLLSRDDRHCACEHRDEAPVEAVAAMPESLEAAEAAPLLCVQASRPSMRCDTAARCRVTWWPYRGSTGS